MAVATLKLLGSFDLTLSDGTVANLPTQKDRALLAILALGGGKPQSREKLATLLWGDRGETQARDSLKHALTRLRQCFTDATATPIVADRQSVRLETDALLSDVARFERLAGDEGREALEEACALYAGDLLDGIGIRESTFDDWLQVERQRLRRLYEEALTKLLAPSSPLATRERAARRLIELDPLREAASRALMQVHAERGETAQAIKLFESLRDRLHAELGVKPEAETLKLHQALRDGLSKPELLPVAAAPDAPAMPGKPSIAVLPFQNLSGDPEQAYFADGIVDEIITALSRMRWLFVIARNSSFTYKGRAVDVKRVGSELGVRYVLEGSVRKAGNRVRITGQLVEAATGATLWADRFEGGLEDIFDLQDQVTASVVGAIAPKLQRAEIDRAKRKPTGSLDAYDYYLRGTAEVHRWNREGNDEALSLFRRAVDLDPDFASAYGMAAGCYLWRKANGWTMDRALEVSEARRLSWRAVELGKDDPVALCWGGITLAYVVGDPEDGAAFIDQALVLDPNFAAAWSFSGWARIWLGEPEIAIDHVNRAIRLSPLDPLAYNRYTAVALAHFVLGRYDEASAWVERALREQPAYASAVRLSAASHALGGRLDGAHVAIARLRQIDPTFRISDLRDRVPLRQPADLARYAEALRKAGLPE